MDRWSSGNSPGSQPGDHGFDSRTVYAIVGQRQSGASPRHRSEFDSRQSLVGWSSPAGGGLGHPPGRGAGAQRGLASRARGVRLPDCPQCVPSGHPCPGSPTGRGTALRPRRLGVRIPRRVRQSRRSSGVDAGPSSRRSPVRIRYGARRKDGREAQGVAPLRRTGASRRGFESHSFRGARAREPLWLNGRATVYEAVSCRFESCQGYEFHSPPTHDRERHAADTPRRRSHAGRRPTSVNSGSRQRPARGLAGVHSARLGWAAQRGRGVRPSPWAS
jgi:hypothetical protein